MSSFRNMNQRMYLQRRKKFLEISKQKIQKTQESIIQANEKKDKKDPLNFLKRLDKLESTNKQISKDVTSVVQNQTDEETKQKIRTLESKLEEATISLKYLRTTQENILKQTEKTKTDVQVIEQSQYENIWFYATANKNLYLFNNNFESDKNTMIQKNEIVLLNYPLFETKKSIWVQTRRLYDSGLVKTFWVKLVNNMEPNFTNFTFNAVSFSHNPPVATGALAEDV